MRRIIYLLGYLIAPILAAAQVTNGELRVTVNDSLTGTPLQYVNVGVWREGALKTGGVTDSTGVARVRDLNEGFCDVKVSFIGYATYNIKAVRIYADRITDLTVLLPEEVYISGGVTVEHSIVYKCPFIPDPVIRRDSIKNLPFLNDLKAVVNQNAGVFAPEGFAMSVGGNRPGAVQTYWNGITLSNGLGSFPLSALDNVSLIQSGISAEYGDFTGAAITVATPRPGLFKHNSIQLLSSSMFDKYHNNYAELFSMGPLIVKNKGRGDSARVKLGYLFAANYQYQADRFPSAIGVWRVKPDKLKELEAAP
ncbi:MAG TPA: carboxypeptidase regulatory-like domain-containing protein, partial [Bacteroidia bacterium]|nr:carboxypeptidase regulatory-like domain-containing protein [Bacteroidia bacterium]